MFSVRYELNFNGYYLHVPFKIVERSMGGNAAVRLLGLRVPITP